MSASSTPTKRPEMVEVPPNAFYVPSPTVLVSTRSVDGVDDVSTMSAVGVVCLQPPVIAIGIKPSRRTYRNIRQTGRFVVNVPLEQDLWGVDYVGTRKLRNRPDKIAEAGLSMAVMPRTGLPYVQQCPVVMACELAATLGRNELGLRQAPSHQVVVGRIQECLVDSTWLGEDEVRLEDMPVILYLNRVYARCGERLGVQRYTDDPAKRDAKMREYRSLGEAGATTRQGR